MDKEEFFSKDCASVIVFFRYPRTYSLSGFTFYNVAQVVWMKALQIGIFLDPEYPIRFSLYKLAIMLFKIFPEGFYNLRTAVPFINRIIIAPEVFFDF